MTLGQQKHLSNLGGSCGCRASKQVHAESAPCSCRWLARKTHRTCPAGKPLNSLQYNITTACPVSASKQETLIQSETSSAAWHACIHSYSAISSIFYFTMTFDPRICSTRQWPWTMTFDSKSEAFISVPQCIVDISLR